jgi:hypothetical protein
MEQIGCVRAGTTGSSNIPMGKMGKADRLQGGELSGHAV